MINQDQFTGLLRWLIAAASGYVVNRGIADAGTVQIVSGIIVAVAMGGWSLWANAHKQIISSAAAIPYVKSVVLTDPAKAAAIANDNVISTAQNAAQVSGRA